MKLETGSTHDLILSVRKAQNTQNAVAIGIVTDAEIYLTDAELRSLGVTREQADRAAEMFRIKIIKALPPICMEAPTLQEQIST